MAERLYNRLLAIRTERGLTQAGLAELVGVSRKTINTVENGIFIPSTLLALKLARALGRPVEDLFSLEPDPQELVRMTISDIELAERHARTRSLIMAVMAVVLLILGLLGWRDDASSMSPMLRHGMWAITILFWLLILATGGWLKLSRDVRRLMNDEVALAHRASRCRPASGRRCCSLWRSISRASNGRSRCARACASSPT